MYRNPLIHTILEVYSFRTSPYSLELYLYDVHFYIYVCKCEIYSSEINIDWLIDWPLWANITPPLWSTTKPYVHGSPPTMVRIFMVYDHIIFMVFYHTNFMVYDHIIFMV